jgi:hypothetical protein
MPLGSERRSSQLAQAGLDVGAVARDELVVYGGGLTSAVGILQRPGLGEQALSHLVAKLTVSIVAEPSNELVVR